MDKEYKKERQEIHEQLDAAINKIFSENVKEREAGRQELEKLRGKDDAVPFFIGYSYQGEYERTGNIDDAQKALEEYNSIVNEGYRFLENAIRKLRTGIGK